MMTTLNEVEIDKTLKPLNYSTHGGKKDGDGESEEKRGGLVQQVCAGLSANEREKGRARLKKSI